MELITDMDLGGVVGLLAGSFALGVAWGLFWRMTIRKLGEWTS